MDTIIKRLLEILAHSDLDRASLAGLLREVEQDEHVDDVRALVSSGIRNLLALPRSDLSIEDTKAIVKLAQLVRGLRADTNHAGPLSRLRKFGVTLPASLGSGPASDKRLASIVDGLATILASDETASVMALSEPILVLLGRMFFVDDVLWSFDLSATDCKTIAEALTRLNESQFSNSVDLRYLASKMIEADDVDEPTKDALTSLTLSAKS